MFNIDQIPAELKKYTNWVAWKIEVRNGKETKVPIDAKSGKNASSIDPRTWTDISTASEYFKNHRGNGVKGVGFAFDKTRLAGIDLDKCRNPETGDIQVWAKRIIEKIHSYSEISPSETGVKIFCEGNIPPGKHVKSKLGPNLKGKIELYDKGRYFTVTGNHLAGTPTTIEPRSEEISQIHRELFPEEKPEPTLKPTAPTSLSDAELIEKAKTSKNGEAFSKLWGGDWQGAGQPSPSEADLALCYKLAFWCGNDRTRVDILFRQSGLMRPKWDEKHFGDGRTYGEETISKAILGTTEVYSPGKSHRERKFYAPIGSKIPKEAAQQIINDAPLPPDTDLKQAIIGLLLPGKDRPPPMIRRQEAGKLLLDWLNNKGGFIQGEDASLFFFHRPERRLYDLSSERWAAWLYSLTGTNPAGTDYAYLLADCKATGIFAPRRKVLRFAAWDGEALRVSRFDGTVFKLDGQAITEEANGENVLFLDDSSWTPYTPDFSTGGHLLWLTTDLPNWDDNREMYGLVLRAWALSIFFCELCPTRPILVLLGERGSGKSMLLRLVLRLLFGPLSELSGIPDRPDGFTAAAASTHLLAMDNLDEFTPWLRDKLASLSTGKVDEYRRLYTSNELGRVYYRCWTCFTARTPDTLRRDDLTDRLLILPLKRLDEWDAERNFLTKADELRNLWWGEVLTYLNKVVAEINKGHLESKSNLRLADWESLCRIVANLEGSEFIWETFVENLKQDQADFLLDGNPIVEAMNLWLETPENNGREIKARELYNELKITLFGDAKPTKDWPKTVRTFGKQLVSIRHDLKRILDVSWTTDRKGFVFYQFSRIEE